MNIAIVGDGWWRRACEVAGETVTVLAPAIEPPANPYIADAAARTAIGARWIEALEADHADAMLDNGGAGLAFHRNGADASSVSLVHEQAHVPLLSHWIDPLVTVFQNLPWPAVWHCLQSDTWFKFVWDKSQSMELDAFGVPHVHHLPMAAPDREYNTTPLTPEDAEVAVSFVGGQNTSYFSPQCTVPAPSLLFGTLAQAVRADMPDICFYTIYHELYRLAEPPSRDEPLENRIAKAQAFYDHKLFYNASLCIKQRDRFVIFLKHKLGDTFALFGDRWDQAYGLQCAPPLPTQDAYLDQFRKSAVNLNFVNGNAESGLNMRHFEITAAGGFMLCYHQSEIQDLFDVGTECDTFRTEQELLEKIRFYLEHTDRRVEIARAGQRRTLSEHLYSHRLKSMLERVRISATAEVAQPAPVPHTTRA